jgi:hypothetical protein
MISKFIGDVGNNMKKGMSKEKNRKKRKEEESERIKIFT